MTEVNEEYILDYIRQNGGKIKNSTLIQYFRNYLKRSAANQESFRDIINKLCVNKKLAEGNDRELTLRKQYRDRNISSSPNLESLKKIENEQKQPLPKSDELSLKTDEKTNDPFCAETDSNSLLSSVLADVSSLQLDKSNTTAKNEKINLELDNKNPMSTKNETNSNKKIIQPTIIVENEPDVSINKLSEDVIKTKVDSKNFDNIPEPEETKIITDDSYVREKTCTDNDTTLNNEEIILKTPEVKEDKENILVNDIPTVKNLANKLNKIQKDSDEKKAEEKQRQPLRKIRERTNVDDQTDMQFSGLEREWMFAACKCDLESMIELLKSEPKLVEFCDITNGTFLHWASKKGLTDIINTILRICKQKNVSFNVDIKSGYTALHLAAIYRKPRVIDLLVEIYKADIEVRDHSGNRPSQYFNYKLLNTLRGRNIGLSVPVEESNFKRIGSYSEKTALYLNKATSALGLRRSWADGVDEISTTPTLSKKNSIAAGLEYLFRSRRSPSQSPKVGRKHSASDISSMPPPEYIPKIKKANEH